MGLFAAARVGPPAGQYETPVAILAFDEIIVAHLIPDFGMPERAAAPIAGDPACCHHDDFGRCVNISSGRHVGTLRSVGGLQRRAAAST